MSDDRNGKTCSLAVCASCTLICCRDANPPITPKRMAIIIDYLKKNNISAENVFAREGHLHPVTTAEGFCTFYSKATHKCMVHPVKPETCTAGPVTFDINLKACKVEFYLKKGEICNLAEIMCHNKLQFKEHFEAAKTVLLRLICDLELNDLKNLMMIEEPQTFKIGEADLPREVAEKFAIA